MPTVLSEAMSRRLRHILCAPLVVGSLLLAVPAAANDGIPIGDRPTKVTNNIVSPKVLLSSVTPGGTGVVTWTDDQGRLIAAAGVTANIAQYVPASPLSGIKAIETRYLGDCDWQPSSTVSPFAQTRERAEEGRPAQKDVENPQTGILFTGTADTINNPVNLTAQVYNGQDLVQGGSVTFQFPGSNSGPVPVKDGVAAFSVPANTLKKPGRALATALYKPDPTNSDYESSLNCLLFQLDQ